MKSQYKGLKYTAILMVMVCVFHNRLNAQTYASPELKAKAEKHEAAKAAKLGSIPAKEEKAAAETKKRIPFDYSLAEGAYRLKSVEAVDYSGKHTPEEMEAFKQEAKGEFDSKDWVVSIDRSVLYTIQRKDVSNFRKLDFLVEGKNLQGINCKTCQDVKFEIIEKSPDKLILEAAPQEKDKHFKYRFSFTK